MNKKLLLPAFVVLIIMGLTGYAFHKSFQKLIDSEQWLQQTEQVIYQSAKVLSQADEMETAAQGFVITGDSSFLALLNTAEKTPFKSIAKLKQLTLDNAGQQLRVDSLEKYMQQRLYFSHQLVRLREKQGINSIIAYNTIQQGRECTNYIRQITNEIQDAENKLQKERKQVNIVSLSVFNGFLAVLYVLIVVFAILLLISTFNLRLQQKSASQLKVQYAVLEQEAIEHTAQLSTQERILVLQNGENMEQAGELIAAGKELALQNKINEKERLQNESRLARAQKIAHMGSWELDFNSLVVILSEEACRIVGLAPTDNIQSLESCKYFLHSDDRPFVLKHVMASYQSLTDTAFDHRIVRKDGSIRYVHSESKFELNASQKPIGLYGIAYDITEKKLAERQLEFDGNNLTSLINNTNDLMWSVDRDFALITFNQPLEKAVWFASGKKIKKGINMISVAATAEQSNKYKRFYERAFNGENFTEIDYESMPAERWSEISFHPIISEEKVIGTACHSHDITIMKKAKNEINEFNDTLEDRVVERTTKLSEANKALEAFSYSVSHDLRAPARAIISFASLIERDYGTNMAPREKELFEFMCDACRRMNIIIDDLLNLAKFGKEKLRPEPIDMARLIKRIWVNIGKHTTNHAVLELAELETVQADSSMIEQVIINLLSNAIKYSSKKEKPVITIWCERVKDQVTFYVQDNGVGFDMEHYGRLFGAFQRLHKNCEFEGTGVGLMLVKNIIEKHGGTVGAQSKVNEGATFYFTLTAYNAVANGFEQKSTNKSQIAV